MQMSQNLQNFVKFQKFQLESLVDFEKCCKTHIFLQKSVPIQPKTSNILPKFCQPTLSDDGQPAVAAAWTVAMVVAGSGTPHLVDELRVRQRFASRLGFGGGEEGIVREKKRFPCLKLG